MLSTPIAFIIFNRPDLTERVFERIRIAAPSKLYLICDGPRDIVEKQLTDEVRAIVNKVDWSCKVYKIFSEVNLGCKRRVLTGLNEVFEKEETAIIIEDDCLPAQDFFRYCEEVLNYYGNNSEFGTVNGTSFFSILGNSESKFSYAFTRLCVVWGWATTRRVWKMVDGDIREWDALENTKWIESIFKKQPEIAHAARRMFFHTKNGVDAWSYALLFTLLKNNLKCIHPYSNLISNIGFDERATHTKDKTRYSNLPLESISNPIFHPPSIEVDVRYDQVIYDYLYHWNFKRPSYKDLIYIKIRKLYYFLKSAIKM